jgi:tyrosine-specific transport protein
VDFLADGLKIQKDKSGKILLSSLVIILPLIFAIVYPKIFLLALSYAGSFGAVILFGILPVAMVWAGRYYKKTQAIRLLPGGKISLILLLFFALTIIGLQVYNDVLIRMTIGT